MNASRADRVALFFHSGAYERLHQGCAIAASAAAAGRPVDLYFFGFALEALAMGKFAEPSFPGRQDLADRFERLGHPTAQELLDAARATGRCTLYACTAASALVGLAPDRVAACVDHHVGWATILEASRGVTDRFDL